GGRSLRRTEARRKPSLMVSPIECAPSASIALDPASAPARIFAKARTRFAAPATSTVFVVSALLIPVGYPSLFPVIKGVPAVVRTTRVTLNLLGPNSDPAGMSQVLVASNRGPVSFSLSEDGALTMRRGGGGLVSGLAAVPGAPRDPGPPRPAGATVSPGTGSTATGAAGTGAEPPADDPDVLWVCASLGEGDRTAARRSPDGRIDLTGYETGGAAVRMLDIPEATFQRAYNAVANSTLWFVHHLLYDTPRSPHFDARARRDWQSYEAYNAAFADALARDAAQGAKAAI